MHSNLVNYNLFSLEGAVRRTLRRADSLFEKLLYLSGVRNAKTSRYADPGLSLDFGQVEISAALRQRHEKTFADWLALTLEEQHAEVCGYLRDEPRPGALLRQWRACGWQEQMIPLGAMPAARELFLSDFGMLLDLLQDEFRREAATDRDEPEPGDGSASGAADLPLAGEAEVKRLLYRTLAKEHLAGLWERGKLKVERYLEEINKLRKAEDLPAILPPAPRRRNRMYTPRVGSWRRMAK